MTRRLAVVIAVSGLTASLLSAQVPAGPEVHVAGEGSKDPSVAANASGDFVVIWHHIPELNSIRGRRLGLSGSPVSPPFGLGLVNRSFANADVAVAADGKGVAVWRDSRSQTSRVSLRRFDGEVSPQGAAQVVTKGRADHPAVAFDRNGHFVVVWTGVFPQYVISVSAARFDASGTPVGDPFLVHPDTAVAQDWPDIATDESGGFVVVWQRHGNPSIYEIYGQRFDAAGIRRGGQFRVNTTTIGTQRLPAVAMQDGGSFVVVWHDSTVDKVQGQLFAASGDRIGSEFPIASSAAAAPSIAADASGSFVVVWRPFGSDVLAQRFDSTGSRRGNEFRVNTYPAPTNIVPVVASDRVGNFLVAWSRGGGSEDEVHAQAFGGLVPASLEVDAAGNQVLEPGESVEVRPSWRSANETPQTFGGVLSDASPPGTAIEITDATSSYGTVATGDVAGCTECYRATVSAALPRPSTHWDAFVREEITPEAHGQRQRWNLHIGDSFTDVPRTNAFYQHVETLLHHGVETGCSGTMFCPNGTLTRPQMANVVQAARKATAIQPSSGSTPAALRGDPDAITREEAAILALRTADPSHDPPACTTPMFNDVPADSRHCRWIEELARRDAVVACGGGNFCPTSPLTRGEMAAFVTAAFGLQLYGP